jgi:hypothetical protein
MVMVALPWLWHNGCNTCQSNRATDHDSEVDGDKANELHDIKIRNNAGQMISVRAIAMFRLIEGPTALDIFNGQHMVQFAANPGSDVTLEQARRQCEIIRERLGENCDSRRRPNPPGWETMARSNELARR